ncbi:MAG: DUF3494 domain-containing protein [Thermoleophilia bacterium]|nr:DUF3494 domain-containing protein [Thermoleophilia bacterium]
MMLLSTGAASASTPAVLLGTANSYGLLGGSTITNTGPSIITGDLGLFPGTSLIGFPPGTVSGATHLTDAAANKAKDDLTTAYKDAAGRSKSATLPADLGGKNLTAGVYRTGSVPSLGLTGNVTLNAQGDPNAVFIFQIESTLITAAASSVSLANGAQSCNVFWQVGSSATLGTTTSFRGNILALSAISVSNAVTVDGRLFARNAAVTLINDTVTSANCATGTIGGGGGGGGGTTTNPGPDITGPTVTTTGLPKTDCTTRNFRIAFKVVDGAGIGKVRVYIDGRLVKSSKTVRSSVAVNVRGLPVGTHRVKVVAYDRAGNRTITRRTFARCTLAVVAPRFTG